MTIPNVAAYLLFVALLMSSGSAWAIKKCQDQDGKWHYGDVAVEACRQSKITTLDKRGFVTDEQAAPMTEAELAAQAKAQEEADAAAEREREEREERQRILSIYETEADIVRQRDNQLYSVQSNIDVHKAYLKSLDERMVRESQDLEQATQPAQRQKLEESIESTKASIKTYSKQLADLQEQKKEISERFADELALYRKLTTEKD